jgi:hypothetical protein
MRGRGLRTPLTRRFAPPSPRKRGEGSWNAIRRMGEEEALHTLIGWQILRREEVWDA